jgi:hypothetical protein
MKKSKYWSVNQKVKYFCTEHYMLGVWIEVIIVGMVWLKSYTVKTTEWPYFKYEIEWDKADELLKRIEE